MGGIRRKQLNKKAPKGAYLLELKNVSRHVQHIEYFAVILLLL